MASNVFLDGLELLLPIVYGGVFLAALFQWRLKGGPAFAWLTATFGVFALAVLAGQVLPEGSEEPFVVWARKALVPLLVLFPYCLYRFMIALLRPIPWIQATATLTAVVLFIWGLMLPEFPQAGEVRPLWMQVYLAAFLSYWVLLSGVVAVRLWRAGKGKTAVARRRMRTMGAGALGLSLALVLAGELSESTATTVAVRSLALIAGPLMLTGFAPPYLLRAMWRRGEDSASREAALALMRATSTDEVAATLLPQARRFLGASGALVEGADGEIIAAEGIEGGKARELLAAIGDDQIIQDNERGSLVTFPVGEGRLILVTDPLTSFFGRDEISRVEELVGLADLALSRNRMFGDQQRLAAIVESSGVAITAEDLQGVITSWNRGAETIYGYRSGEIVGERASVLIPPNVQDDMVAARERVRSGETIEQGDVKRQRKDGRIIDVALTISPLRDPSGAVVGVSTVARDVTKRRGMEEELRRASEQLAAAQETAHIGSWAWDPIAGRSSASDEFYCILGLADAAEVLDPGAALMERIHPEDRPGVDAATEHALATNEPLSLEYRIVRDDGSERVLEAHGTGRIEGGVVVSMIGTLQDITERREFEESLRSAKEEAEKAREEAEKANAAKSVFLSRMSHELRTPLNAILGFTQLLDMDPLTREQKEATTEVLKGGRHLLGLIDEVLDIARIEAGSLRLSLEPVDATRVTQECISLLTPLADQMGVSVALEQNEVSQDEVFVTADYQRLKQVLLNLVANAIKFNRSGGSVRVSFEKTAPDRRLKIKVSDTGVGISPDRIERLFVPFERLEAEAAGIEGTGLGLALTKPLVEAMGGRIEVESEAGVGTTFSLEFDSAENPGASAPDGGGHNVEATSGPPRQTRTVLCIEDNLSNLKLVERLIALRPGTSLISAMQGRLGITLARDHQPDLVLLDLDLPDISGEDVLENLRSDPRTAEIPVVVVSADATERQEKKLLEAGASVYLTKPIDVARFLEILDGSLVP